MGGGLDSEPKGIRILKIQNSLITATDGRCGTFRVETHVAESSFILNTMELIIEAV